ncbi:hypothetical protein M3P05_20290, partial [Sansalvadorimonas sp. 2012CJ34-2]
LADYPMLCRACYHREFIIQRELLTPASAAPPTAASGGGAKPRNELEAFVRSVSYLLSMMPVTGCLRFAACIIKECFYLFLLYFTFSLLNLLVQTYFIYASGMGF